MKKEKKRVGLQLFFLRFFSLSLFLSSHRAVEVTAEARVRMATEVMALLL